MYSDVVFARVIRQGRFSKRYNPATGTETGRRHA